MLERVREQLNEASVPFRERVGIAPYTTFRIGGEVALLIEPQTEEQLRAALFTLRAADMRSFLLGRGSNVLFPDEYMSVAVIRTSALRAVRVQGREVTAQCGATLAEISQCALAAGLGGLEFAHGIPGSLGGALYMNAGAYGDQMSDVVSAVSVYDAEQDRIEQWPVERLDYSYRHSALSARPHLTALSAVLTLREDDKAAIEARMQDYRRQRREKQPLEYPSAGSVFKRPEGHFAGALIEQSGLKGYRIGGAEISPRHAGFIVNVGGATAEDVKRLIGHIQCVVARDHGVALEPEIQILNVGNER